MNLFLFLDCVGRFVVGAEGMLVGIIGIVRKHSEQDEGCRAGSGSTKDCKRMSIQLLMKELFFQEFKLFLMLTCYDFIIFIGTF